MGAWRGMQTRCALRCVSCSALFSGRDHGDREEGNRHTTGRLFAIKDARHANRRGSDPPTWRGCFGLSAFILLELSPRLVRGAAPTVKRPSVRILEIKEPGTPTTPAAISGIGHSHPRHRFVCAGCSANNAAAISAATRSLSNFSKPATQAMPPRQRASQCLSRCHPHGDASVKMKIQPHPQHKNRPLKTHWPASELRPHVAREVLPHMARGMQSWIANKTMIIQNEAEFSAGL